MTGPCVLGARVVRMSISVLVVCTRGANNMSQPMTFWRGAAALLAIILTRSCLYLVKPSISEIIIIHESEGVQIKHFSKKNEPP